jgi:hypothetical protein
MHLFQSEWLREPPRPIAHSYARPTYGLRPARQVPHGPTDAADAAVLRGPEWMTLETMPATHPPHLDRAA